MHGLLRSKHSTDNYSLIHLWHLHVTMTLVILKSNYLCNCKDCSYLQIMLNESSWLFRTVGEEDCTKDRDFWLLKITRYHQVCQRVARIQDIYFPLMPIYTYQTQELSVYIHAYPPIFQTLLFFMVLWRHPRPFNIKHILLTDQLKTRDETQYHHTAQVNQMRKPLLSQDC